MNAKVNVSFQIKSFCLLIYISNNRITVSYGNSIFLLLRNSHIIFCSSCINVHSHSQCKRVPFSLHLLQHLLFADILMVILTGRRWYIIVILICIILKVSIVEYLFVCLWAICTFSLEKCLFRSIVYFLHWVVWFFKLSCYEPLVYFRY